MKYFVKTYGCQMNVHESEKLNGMLESLGYEPSDSEKDADIIVFNTCAIRDGVEQKIFGNIGALKSLKKQKKDLIIAVCGCMSQAEGRAKTIKEKFPFVNIIFGTHNIHKLKEYIISYQATKKSQIDVWNSEQGIFEDINIKRDNVNYNAWVNIIYGCNNFCSYCIVPYVRGRERSRTIDDILVEVKDLISQGYKYITLLGQNVNSYGNDLKDGTNFSKLLSTIASLDGDFKIKFMSSHPKDFTDDVIETIAKYDKIAKVIHLPVQSGSTNILKSMNRKYTREHYLEVINKIKKSIPNVYISTDIIVGFPGETEEDFMETYSLVEEVRFDGVFAFIYSVRSGTVAANMPNHIPEDIKNERVNRLLKLTKSITKENNKYLIDKEFNVIVKEKTNDGYIVMTDSGKNITILDKKELKLGEFYTVKIISFEDDKLIAKLI